MKEFSTRARAKPDVRSIVDDIYVRYGYDLRHRKPNELWRNFERMLANSPGENPMGQDLGGDDASRARSLASYSVKSLPLFASRNFVAGLRQKVIPYLKTFPSLKIWLAGCGTGEEIYALSILLKEEGAPKFVIYATDLSEYQLSRAQLGYFSAQSVTAFERSYLDTGGQAKLRNFFHFRGDGIWVKPQFKQGVFFFQHNLASDASFNEFHLVLCRNNISYLGDDLKACALRVLDGSLYRFGILGLGEKDGLQNSALEPSYRAIDLRARIYKKIGHGV